MIIINTNALPEQSMVNRLEAGQRWITFGLDNLLPDRLIQLNQRSPTHSGIIKKKTDFCAGNSVIYTNPEFEKWGDNIDNGGGMHNLISKLAMDLFTHGGYAIQVIWYKHQRKIADILYTDFSNLRRGFRQGTNEDDFTDQCLWFSLNWRDRLKFIPEPFNEFSPEPFYDPALPIPQDPQFLYYFRPTQGLKWYPLPDYFAAYQAIETEVELLNFMNANVRQSFNPSGMLNVPGVLTPEEELVFKAKVKTELSGTDNTGKIFTVFSDGDKTVSFAPFNNSPDDKKVNDYMAIIEQKIITAHQLPSPTIIGLPGGASLSGDANTILAATKTFYTQTILKARNEILFQLNKLVEMAGFPDKIQIEENIPDFSPAQVKQINA